MKLALKLGYGVMSAALVLTAAQGLAQSGVPASVAGQAPKTASERNPKVYRVTYTFTEMDGGKRLGVQHYSLVLTDGGRSTLKNGSKVPVATGSYAISGRPSGEAQTQFTYLDVGTNIDTTLSSPVDGTWQVKVKVEQSSVTEDKSIAGVNEPIVRQSVLEALTSLTLGKPQIVGTLDFPGSTRHLEVEMVLEAVK